MGIAIVSAIYNTFIAFLGISHIAIALENRLSLNTLELLSKAYSNPLWVKGQSLVLLRRTDRIQTGDLQNAWAMKDPAPKGMKQCGQTMPFKSMFQRFYTTPVMDPRQYDLAVIHGAVQSNTSGVKRAILLTGIIHLKLHSIALPQRFPRS
uniref:Uncharacterized protein n=1 Tax=Globodera rostochiensis TaxID=31243 RepID=A0A914HBW4_GLORO